MREEWQPGEVAWFEYHCQESDNSADAPAWCRSHQRVTVLGRGRDEDWPGTLADRAEAACPNVYQVRFADRLQWTAFEDELLTGPEHFERPDPPACTCRCGNAILRCGHGPGLLTGGESGTVECRGWVHAGDGWHLCYPAEDASAPVAEPAGSAAVAAGEAGTP